jgi:hypothetical protein
MILSERKEEEVYSTEKEQAMLAMVHLSKVRS